MLTRSLAVKPKLGYSACSPINWRTHALRPTVLTMREDDGTPESGDAAAQIDAIPHALGVGGGS